MCPRRRMTDELRERKKKKSITIRVTVELGSIPFHPPNLQFSPFKSDEAVFQHVSSDLCSSIPAGYHKPILWLTLQACRPLLPTCGWPQLCWSSLGASSHLFALLCSNPAPFNTRADGWGTAILRALRSATVPARVVVRQPAEGLKP